MTGIPWSSYDRILTEDLKIKCVSTKSHPFFSQKSMDVCCDMKEKSQLFPVLLVKVTDDETWP